MLTSLADWYNRANDNEQQQRLGRVLEIVQDLKALLTLLSAQPITFILDLACLASRRGYLKLDKWLTDKFYDHQVKFSSVSDREKFHFLQGFIHSNNDSIFEKKSAAITSSSDVERGFKWENYREYGNDPYSSLCTSISITIVNQW